jgi:hypothetical protein
LEEELGSHIQLRSDELERSGCTRAEAERRARIEFGSRERFKEECREALAGNFIDTMIQDVRFSFRILRKSPAFFAVAVVTLVLGIGATVAAFSSSTLCCFGRSLSTIPRSFFGSLPSARMARERISPEYCDYRDQQTSFEGLAAIGSYSANLYDWNEPERVQGVRVSTNIFSILGLRPLAGRSLVMADDLNGAPGVAMISYGLWSRRYARNASVIGQSVHLNGESRQIVGVLPQDFALPNLDTDVVVPLQPDSDPRRSARNSVSFLRFVGQLKPNVTREQAYAELNSIRQNLRRQFPDAYAGKIGIAAVPLTQEIVANVHAVLVTIFVRPLVCS